MDPQRVAIAIITIFLCYCLLAVLYQDDGGFSEKLDLSRSFELTDFENSETKAGKEFWDSIHPRFPCPAEQLERVGNPSDGGKWTCGLIHLGWITEKHPESNCLVYSFGVSGDSTFEAEVLKNTRCTVYAYDPTVNKIAKPLNSSNPRIHFQKLGVGGKDDSNHHTLRTMMLENGGHIWIDIVKMDVEGYEYDTLGRVLEDFEEIPFGQLLVEFHVNKWDPPANEKVLGLMKNLEAKGMRMFYKEVNVFHPEICSEFSFINTKALDRFMELEHVQKISTRT